ncbi:benzoyl-CoA 2,3-epoxidase subunit BoxA [Limobrevibacterium gyesilva]|uniref:Benzoyl-CoA 2,3-epoxidase subunit BoxA n=1 Tax=Limobrevibacterium gyesilva TaxID=2991712 RepID=A0AA41YNA0_9PROT|nr:benzoyl-CoA 2,3-epoxidase subunit BoxA [Limobrevibacterium gyesilva]MCW3476649.1 benzoyl-CoA 2,3-epoxidase subunit BoxA [Limobrevibacterium gyesilva]
MTAVARVKQHLIDPEICIRCNTCEATCPVGAITHDANNYVVDAAVCNFCMDCVAPCPTGSIDNWFMVEQPFTVDDQFGWNELPPRPAEGATESLEAIEDEASALLAEAHARAGGRARAPATASKPRINLFNRDNPAIATVTGNFRITAADAESDVRHIILDFGTVPFPVLEGQSIGILPPGTDAAGGPHAMRLYSIASSRDGERPNTNNLALTVKRVREPRDGGVFQGVASTYLCDLKLGEKVQVVGPYGATFLMPDDPDADIVMICTGTGAAPFRGFTERRRRTSSTVRGKLLMFFGARTPQELPYFGPLQKVPAGVLDKELVYSRRPGAPREYVQDRMRTRAGDVAELLRRETTHVFVCGLRGLEDGVEQAMSDIGRQYGIDWPALRARMLEGGRYHAETY